jgi:DNA phosphorothioation-associated putative methyltransferase
LQGAGIAAEGWDPFFAPDVELRAANVVMLSYVINVIEDVDERVEVLRRAFALARDVLIVAVRVENGIAGVPAGKQGSWTGAGTFQKFFTHSEFLGLLASTLRIRPHSPATGVAYAFKTAQAEQEHEKRRSPLQAPASKVLLIDAVTAFGDEDEFAALARQLGRLPTTDEWVYEIRSRRTSSAPPGTDETVARLEDRRREVVTFLALLRLYRIHPPNFRALSAAMRREIMELWGSYYSALQDAAVLADVARTPDGLMRVRETR